MRGRPRDSPRGRRLEHRVHPRRLLRQQQGRRPHAIARGIESRRRDAPGPERDGGVEQTLPHADDADVRPAQPLERAVVISLALGDGLVLRAHTRHAEELPYRSEEHTSELQSLTNLVCRLLLEKKKKKKKYRKN